LHRKKQQSVIASSDPSVAIWSSQKRLDLLTGKEIDLAPDVTTKPSGLGMGLSICRSIVEAHGGKLWATPNEPRGAVFCMKLPVGENSIESLEPSSV
jgi:light-regulated signal transduction histidine kinase (bacteriophytochrome)